LGKVALASGDSTYKLDPYGDDLIAFTVAENDVNQLHATDGTPLGVENTGTIKAEGGVVLLSATQLDGIVSSVVNNGGSVSAASAEAKGGKIIFRGEGENVDVVNSGTATASSEAGDGGVVRMVADGKVTVSGTVEARGTAKGGRVDVSGRKETLIAGAKISTEGKEGGLVRLGGEFQGGKEKMGTDADMQRNFVERFGPLGPLAETATLTVDSASEITAGSNGTLIAWSGGETNIAGSLTAKFLETSGKHLTVARDPVLNGKGTWLIDPENIIIGQSNGNQDITSDRIEANWLGDYIESNASSIIYIVANDYILINSPLEYASGSLDLSAGRAIYVNSPIYFNNRLELTAGERINIASDIGAKDGQISLDSEFFAMAPNIVISGSSSAYYGLTIAADSIGFIGESIKIEGSHFLTQIRGGRYISMAASHGWLNLTGEILLVDNSGEIVFFGNYFEGGDLESGTTSTWFPLKIDAGDGRVQFFGTLDSGDAVTQGFTLVTFNPGTAINANYISLYTDDITMDFTNIIASGHFHLAAGRMDSEHEHEKNKATRQMVMSNSSITATENVHFVLNNFVGYSGTISSENIEILHLGGGVQNIVQLLHESANEQEQFFEAKNKFVIICDDAGTANYQVRYDLGPYSIKTALLGIEGKNEDKLVIVRHDTEIEQNYYAQGHTDFWPTIYGLDPYINDISALERRFPGVRFATAVPPLVTISSAATSGITGFSLNANGQLQYTGASDDINLNINELLSAISTNSAETISIISQGGLVLKNDLTLTKSVNLAFGAQEDILLNGALSLRGGGNLNIVSAAGDITLNGDLLFANGTAKLEASAGDIFLASSASLRGAKIEVRSDAFAALVGSDISVESLGIWTHEAEFYGSRVEGRELIDVRGILGGKAGVVLVDAGNGANATFSGREIRLWAGGLVVDKARFDAGTLIDLDADYGSIGGGASFSAPSGTIKMGLANFMTIAAGSENSPIFQAAEVKFWGAGSITIYPWAVKTGHFLHEDGIQLEGRQTGGATATAPHIFGLNPGWFNGYTPENWSVNPVWPFRTVVLQAAGNPKLYPASAGAGNSTGSANDMDTGMLIIDRLENTEKLLVASAYGDLVNPPKEIYVSAGPEDFKFAMDRLDSALQELGFDIYDPFWGSIRSSLYMILEQGIQELVEKTGISGALGMSNFVGGIINGIFNENAVQKIIAAIKSKKGQMDLGISMIVSIMSDVCADELKFYLGTNGDNTWVKAFTNQGIDLLFDTISHVLTGKDPLVALTLALSSSAFEQWTKAAKEYSSYKKAVAECGNSLVKYIGTQTEVRLWNQYAEANGLNVAAPLTHGDNFAEIFSKSYNLKAIGVFNYNKPDVQKASARMLSAVVDLMTAYLSGNTKLVEELEYQLTRSALYSGNQFPISIITNICGELNIPFTPRNQYPYSIAPGTETKFMQNLWLPPFSAR
jgi:hypothetical protein